MDNRRQPSSNLYKRKYQHLFHRWFPQGLRELINRLIGHAITYRGVFSDWDDAVTVASGYTEISLLHRIEEAALAVKRGEAAWDQDGFTFNHIPPDFPLLTCLSRVALEQGGQLSILDFGGALGNTYRQCRAYLPEVKKWRWHIVEQLYIVESGRRNFENEEIHFHTSLKECLDQETPNIALLSSVLQYLPDPYGFLQQLANSPIQYLIINRNPCSLTKELITVQMIPQSLYRASYPSWLFDCEQMRKVLNRNYERLMEWDCKDPPIRGRGIGAHFTGVFLRKRGEE